MAHTEVELRLVEALEERAGQHGIDVVDVEVGGTGRTRVVRVRIDHADEALPTITLDEVGEHTAWIDAVVDAVDPFEGSYRLEVSSPGMDRPLRRSHDFERFAGQSVSLATTAVEGRRRYTGTLLGMRGGKVALSCDDGEFLFALDEIKSCTIRPDYDAAYKAAKASAKGGK